MLLVKPARVRAGAMHCYRIAPTTKGLAYDRIVRASSVTHLTLGSGAEAAACAGEAAREPLQPVGDGS